MFISPDHGDPGDQPPRRHQQAAGDAGHTVRQVLRPAPVKMVDNGLEDDQNNDVGDDLDVSKDVYVDILLFETPGSPDLQSPDTLQSSHKRFLMDLRHKTVSRGSPTRCSWRVYY